MNERNQEERELRIKKTTPMDDISRKPRIKKTWKLWKLMS